MRVILMPMMLEDAGLKREHDAGLAIELGLLRPEKS
jgi:hypothetical protein